MSYSSPHIFDPAIVVPKCQVNRYGEANCLHVHARDLPSQNEGGWAGEGDELVPKGWTAQTVARDPRIGQPIYQCGLCGDEMTLEETKDHSCA